MRLRLALSMLLLVLPTPCMAGRGFLAPLYAVDDEGIVHVYGSSDGLLHRWSLAERRTLEPFLLLADPVSLVYSAAQDLLYVQYETGYIEAIDPSTGVAQSVANVDYPCGLLATDLHLIACGLVYPNAAARLRMFDAAGTLQGESDVPGRFEPGPRGVPLAWNAELRRVYTVESQVCHMDVGDDGSLMAPYCADVVSPAPLRAADDGSLVLVLASQPAVLDGESLLSVDWLFDSRSTQPTDAIWLADGRLLTLHERYPDAEVHLWDPELGYVGSIGRPGRARALVAWNGGVYLLVELAGEPYAWRIEPERAPLSVLPLSGRQRLSFARLGAVRADLSGAFRLEEDGSFTLCVSGGCLVGELVPADSKGLRFELRPDTLPLADLESGIERAVGEVLSDAFRHPVTAALAFDPSSLRLDVTLNRSRSRAKLRFRVEYDAQLTGGGRSRMRGIFSWKAPRATLLGSWPTALP